MNKLRWNKDQTAVYKLVESGERNKDIKAQGFSSSCVRKVRTAFNQGDMPPKVRRQKERLPADISSGEALFSATFTTTKVTLDPMVAVRYDSVRHALGLTDEYTLEQFLDESTDLVAELVGAVPPGFVKDEEMEVTAV